MKRARKRKPGTNETTTNNTVTWTTKEPGGEDALLLPNLMGKGWYGLGQGGSVRKRCCQKTRNDDRPDRKQSLLPPHRIDNTPFSKDVTYSRHFFLPFSSPHNPQNPY